MTTTLNELGDALYPVTQSASGSTDVFSFKTAAGFVYDVRFRTAFSDSHPRERRGASPLGLSIEFDMVSPEGWRSQRMTGVGDEFRVMGTVAKVVMDYLAANKDEYHKVQFGAILKDRGRVALYRRMAKKISTLLGPSWTFDEKSIPHIVVDFAWTRPYTSDYVTESGNMPYKFEKSFGAMGGDYKFRTEQGHLYWCKVYGWMGDDQDTGEVVPAVMVGFAKYNPDGKDLYTQWQDGTTNDVGKEAVYVFSTVLACLKDYLSTSDECEQVHFGATARDPRKLELYRRFVKAIPRYMSGWEYDYEYDAPDFFGGQNKVLVLSRSKATS